MTFYYDILKAVLAAEGLKAYKVNRSTSCVLKSLWKMPLKSLNLSAIHIDEVKYASNFLSSADSLRQIFLKFFFAVGRWG